MPETSLPAKINVLCRISCYRAQDTPTHFQNDFFNNFDHHNIGLDILFVHLSALLVKLKRETDFSVMATLICICGTFGQLLNIATFFASFFQYRDINQKYISGAAGYPYAPTKLILMNAQEKSCKLDPVPTWLRSKAVTR